MATWHSCADCVCVALVGSCWTFCTPEMMKIFIVLSLLLLSTYRVMSAPKGVTASLKAKWNMTPFLLETRYPSPETHAVPHTSRNLLLNAHQAPQTKINTPWKSLKLINITQNTLCLKWHGFSIYFNTFPFKWHTSIEDKHVSAVPMTPPSISWKQQYVHH